MSFARARVAANHDATGQIVDEDGSVVASRRAVGNGHCARSIGAHPVALNGGADRVRGYVDAKGRSTLLPEMVLPLPGWPITVTPGSDCVSVSGNRVVVTMTGGPTVTEGSAAWAADVETMDATAASAAAVMGTLSTTVVLLINSPNGGARPPRAK